MSDSNAFSITINAGWTPPASGTAVYAPSTNTENSVKPAAYSAAQLAYAAMASYGGGAFMSSYGASGSYVIAGAGGHDADELFDALVYDLDDWAWKWVNNTQGVPHSPTPHVPAAQTNGSPYYELTTAYAGTLTAANAFPAPTHLYNNAVGIGSKYYMMLAGSACVSSVRGLHVHTFDLTTGAWARDSTGTRPNSGYDSQGVEDTMYYDSTSGRIWSVDQYLHTRLQLPYYNLSTHAWALAASSGNYCVDPAGYAQSIFDETNRYLYVWSVGGGNVSRINVDNTGAGWSTVTTGPSISGAPFRWHKWPSANGGNNCFYTYDGISGNSLRKFDPALNQFSTVTVTPVGFSTLPAAYAQPGGTNRHYSRFFYAASRQCFVWIPGGGQSVVLLRP